MGLCKWRNRAALGKIGVAKFIYLSLVEPLIVYCLVFGDPPLSVIGIFVCQKREIKGLARFPSDFCQKQLQNMTVFMITLLMIFRGIFFVKS